MSRSLYIKPVGLFVAVVFSLLSACTVEMNVTDPAVQFSCWDDLDCLEGYVCIGAFGQQQGHCENIETADEECQDMDLDGFLAGPDCDPRVIPDCDDSSPLVNPDQIERCNLIDDDCSGIVDDNLPAEYCPQQYGVCEGSTTSCVGGEYLDCESSGLYGEAYQPVSSDAEICDFLDNDCDGEVDEDCDCYPGTVEACGESLGTCDRGFRLCGEDFFWSDCILGDLGSGCSSNEDCGGGGYCVNEVLNPYEDIFDDCVVLSDESCSRQVCRYLDQALACEVSTDCTGGNSCVSGFCQTVATEPQEEVCDGQDEDCDGRIDNPGTGICPTCPFGMIYVERVTGTARGYCIDAYEASRPDATFSEEGEMELYATSRPNVIPWSGMSDPVLADEICEASELRSIIPDAVPQRYLCGLDELRDACGEEFPYGMDYVAGFCNDTDGVSRTGEFSSCCGESGACDLVGNLAEIFRDNFPGILGGSSVDTAELQTCYWTERLELTELEPEFMGFRCCIDAE